MITNTNELIQKFQELIELNYISELYISARADERKLVIDFNKLIEFDPFLATEVIEHPDEALRCAKLSISRFELEDSENIEIRLTNLPDDSSLKLRDIRSKHLSKLVKLTGIVRQKSDVRPQIASASFECPSCSNQITVLQLGKVFKEPNKCLPKGTLVMTSLGLKKIEEANEVLCLDENYKITSQKSEIIKTGIKKVWKINNYIECSGNHLWYVFRDNKLKVLKTKHLKQGDILYGINRKSMYSMWRGFTELQAWQTYWRAKIQNSSEKNESESLSFLRNRRESSSASQELGSSRSFSHEFGYTMQFVPYKVSRVTETSKSIEMYDLIVPEYHNFILSNGVITHNCGCGRKGKFKLLKRSLIDAQRLVIEECSDELDGGDQAKRMNVLLNKDLVSPISDKKTNPGTKVQVIGMIKEVPVSLRTGGESTTMDLMIEANNITPLEEDFSDSTISDDDVSQIKQLSTDPMIYQNLISSLAPSIYGYENIKEALLFQILGGVRKVRHDGAVSRGDIHILLCCDPSAGKSQLLKRMHNIVPHSKFVSGKGSSGCGLTASVVKDEFLHGWALEAGAIVLSNKSLLCIDEFDKMEKDDRSALHEALEQQTVSVNKANIQATLTCQTSVLAAANPKLSRFDPYQTIFEQIDLPPSLINRFDLIFPIKDTPDKEKDRNMARFILNLHSGVMVEESGLIPTELLRKYLAYARRNIKPKLTAVALTELENYYLKMRDTVSSKGTKSIQISARQLEGLLRLSEASAKARLSNEVSIDDAKRAIDLFEYCMNKIALDDETGTYDIDRISTGLTSSQRNKVSVFRELLMSLDGDKKPVSFDELVKSAVGLSENEIKDAVEKLKKLGEVFEPRYGFIQVMP